MIKGYLIIIPSHLPLGWTADYVYQTARLLAKHNLVVCFLWGEALSIKELILQKRNMKLYRHHMRNFLVYTPVHFLPFRRLEIISQINCLINIWILRGLIHVLRKQMRPRRIIVWTFGLFDSVSHLVLESLHKQAMVLFDCIDYPWNQNKRINALMHKQEQQLIKRADIMTVISKSLYRLYRKRRRDISIVPMGFRQEAFIHPSRSLSIELERDKPIIGLIGIIDYRLNYSLLTRLIENTPQWLFVFVGPLHVHEQDRYTNAKIQQMLNHPNVVYRPAVDKRAVPATIDLFDVGMIPYDVSLAFNRYSYPMKVFEYFYMGKPVVSTDIYALRELRPYITIANSASEWKKSIEALLSSGWPTRFRIRQKQLAQKNSWQHKIEAISRVIKSYEDGHRA